MPGFRMLLLLQTRFPLGLRDDIKLILLGQQTGDAQYVSVNRIPSAARRSRLGVRTISLP